MSFCSKEEHILYMVFCVYTRNSTFRYTAKKFNILSYFNNFCTVNSQDDCTNLIWSKITIAFLIRRQTLKTLHMKGMLTFYFLLQFLFRHLVIAFLSFTLFNHAMNAHSFLVMSAFWSSVIHYKTNFFII